MHYSPLHQLVPFDIKVTSGLLLRDNYAREIVITVLEHYDSIRSTKNEKDMHGPFECVGAEKVVGLTLNQYQQLLRYAFGGQR